MPQHCKKRPSTGSYPRRRLKCSTTTVTTDNFSQTNLVPSSNRRINTNLRSFCAYLPTTYLCSDSHPLKYLQGVRSQLRQSQAEQLPSRPEKRMDQLSLPPPPPDKHCGICSHDPLGVGMCTSSHPAWCTCPGCFLIVVIL